MTVVIADTSPLNYLVLIGEAEILRVLYTVVLVPPEVLAELAGSGAPPQVSDWIQSRLDQETPVNAQLSFWRSRSPTSC